jgi:hypothetical protein
VSIKCQWVLFYITIHSVSIFLIKNATFEYLSLPFFPLLSGNYEQAPLCPSWAWPTREAECGRPGGGGATATQSMRVVLTTSVKDRAAARNGCRRIESLFRQSDLRLLLDVLGAPLAPMPPTSPTPVTAPASTRRASSLPNPPPSRRKGGWRAGSPSSSLLHPRRRPRARRAPPPLPRGWRRDGQGRPTATTPSSPAPLPGQPRVTLLPPSLRAASSAVNYPSPPGARNAAWICGGATGGGACCTAVDPSTIAQEGSAGGEGEHRGRRRGARRADNGERGDPAVVVGSVAVAGGEATRAAGRWIRSGRHLMRRKMCF